MQQRVQRSASGSKTRLPNWLSTRFSGPGALYNLGNVIAIVTGTGLALWKLDGQGTAMEGLHQHLMGSAPAAWLTGSMLVFIVSGELYHAGHHGRPERRAMRTQQADLVSGIAAIGLTIALIGFGDATMAIVAGVMLAGGKLGSAILALWHGSAALAGSLRVVVLGSRFPSILALVLSLQGISNQIAAPSAQDVLLPIVMIGCFLLWLWADVILLWPMLRRGRAEQVT